MVVEVDGGIVLGRRAIEPGYGLWCLPGGFVNDDEDPAAAAVRECMEEIGAVVDVTALIGVYHVAKTTASSIIGIAYRGRLADGETLVAGKEMLEVGVFARDALPSMAFSSHQAILDEYLRSRTPVGPVPLLASAAARPGARPSRTPAQRPPRRTR
jgi:ADP-ribose pyrophosphatase YjhB (NUDIX family)